MNAEWNCSNLLQPQKNKYGCWLALQVSPSLWLWGGKTAFGWPWWEVKCLPSCCFDCHAQAGGIRDDPCTINGQGTEKGSPLGLETTPEKVLADTGELARGEPRAALTKLIKLKLLIHAQSNWTTAQMYWWQSTITLNNLSAHLKDK